MYRPHFCAECGEQVVRLQWRPWTSRSFCENCARRLRRGRLVVPVLVGAALLAGGFTLGHVFRTAPPPLMVLRGNLPAAPVDLTTAASAATDTVSQNSAAAQPEEAGDVYTCGARTKKGTPCSRRVHGPIRCYQHKGMPAMVPQAQLLVKG